MMTTTMTVFLDNYCYECDKSFSQPRTLMNHFQTKHDIVLPKRQTNNKRRPCTEIYTFIKEKEKADAIHSSCPSCWFHCPQVEFNEYKQHIINEHLLSSSFSTDQQVSEYESDYNDVPNENQQGIKRSFASSERMARQDQIVESILSLINGINYLFYGKDAYNQIN